MRRFLLFLAVLSSVAVAGVVWGLSKQLAFNREATGNEAKYYNEIYSIARDACLRLQIKDQLSCISDADNAARQFQREERDLVSQQITAVWTTLMGNAAMVGVLLSVVGAYLVWTTFQETRESNRIMRLERRPWIEITNVRVAYPQVESDCSMGGRVVDAFICSIVFELVNTGGTPARLLFADGAGFNRESPSGRDELERLEDTSGKAKLTNEGRFFGAKWPIFPLVSGFR